MHPPRQLTLVFRPALWLLLPATLTAWPLLLHAQLVADPDATAGQRPVILDTANGLPQVDITTPTAAGVSVNRFRQFDVDAAGAIVNNGRRASQTALAGWVAANPALLAAPARVIVAEVNSPLPSQLDGFVEIAGSRADLILANPAGISCNGCGFLNAQRVELATGTPQWQAGQLSGHRPGPGRLVVAGGGLDARGADALALFTRAAEINAGLWARTLKLQLAGGADAGANSPGAPATTAAADPAPPAFALDVAALGGMYAGRIFLVGTADGLGARNLGTLAAEQQLIVTLDGKLVNSGTLDAADLQLAATAIDNLAHGQMLGKRVAMATGRLANAGHPDAAPVIAAAERLDLGVQALENTDGALLFSGGDLAIGGELDAQGQAVGRAGQVLNRAATIEALGHLRLSAERLDQQNGGIVTEEVQLSEQKNQWYLQPEGQADKVPLSHFYLQDWSRAGQYRWQTDQATIDDGILGQTPIDPVPDESCVGEGDAEVCTPVRGDRYPASDPAWAYFQLKPPDPEPPQPGPPPPEFMLSPPAPPPEGTPVDDPQQRAWQQQQADYEQARTEHQAQVAAHREAELAWQAWDTTTTERRRALTEAVDRYNASFNQRLIRSWTQFKLDRSEFADQVVESNPAQLIAGGDLRLDGAQLTNDRSQILAGGQLTGSLERLTNIAALGTHRLHETGTSQFTKSRWRGGLKRYHQRDWGPALSYAPADVLTTIELPVTRAAGGVAIEAPVLEVAAQRLADDGNALWAVNPGPGPLLATDARFTRYRQWLNSDVMLAQLALDPDRQPQRLGDGFLEQQLVRAQLAQLAGRRWLPGQTNDEAQYATLMANGLAHAQALQLRPGVALSAEQVAQLTTDLVWLVETTVTLPAADGQPARTVTALAPRVYLKPRPDDLAGDGTLMAADSVKLLVHDALVNSGLIAAGRELQVAAGQVAQHGQLAGATVDVEAATDLIQRGGSVTARERATLAAGRDLVLQSSVQESQRQSRLGGGSGHGHGQNRTLDRVASVHVAGGTLQLAAGRDLVLAGADLSQAGDGITRLQAGRDLNLATIATERQVAATGADARHFLREGSRTEVGTRIDAQGALQLAAGQDLTIRAAQVASSDGAVDVVAGRDLRVTSGEASEERAQGSYFKHRSTFGSKRHTVRTETQTSDVLASRISGSELNLSAGRELQIRSSQAVADGDLQLAAGGDLTIDAASAQHTERRHEQHTQSGLMGSGGFGVTLGRRQLDTDLDSSTRTAVGSTVGSIGGDVTVIAGGQVQHTGSQLLAPAGDITVAGAAVTIDAAEHTETTTAQTRVRQSGVTLAVSSPVLAAAQSVQQMARAVRATDDPRMQALAAANSALAMADAAAAVQAGQGSTINGKPNQIATGTDAAGNPVTRDANAIDQLGGVQIAVSIGSSRSHQQQATTATTVAPATVRAGGDLTVAAVGAGERSDLQVRGSTLAAGQQVTLVASDALDLQAAANVREQHSTQRGSSASLGLVIDSNAGMGVQIAGSRDKGRADGHEVHWTETRVTAGQHAQLASGGDTHLNGAVVAAPSVAATVGGDLNIASVQDTRRYQSRQQQVGGSLVIGPASSGQLNLAGSRIDADYASVTTVAGLQAGDGGFDVAVAGDTTLTGAAIASEQAAVDADRNRFATGGELALNDVTNHARYEARAHGVSLGTSISPQGQYQPRGTGMGLGGDSDHQTSVTRAGISGVAGDTGVRTGDAANGVVDRFDAERVQADITAQVTITHEFSTRAPKAVADYAQQQVAQLDARLAATTDPAQRAALVAEREHWQDGGRYRVALHAAVGGLAGGVGGAAGAATAASAAPLLDQWQVGIEDALVGAGVNPEHARGIAGQVSALAAAGAGAVAGGVAGAGSALGVDANNRQLHPKEIDWAKKSAKSFAEKLSDTLERSVSEAEALMWLTTAGESNADKVNQDLAAAQKGLATSEESLAFIAAKQYINENAKGITFVDDLGQVQKLFVGRGPDFYSPSVYSEYRNDPAYRDFYWEVKGDNLRPDNPTPQELAIYNERERQRLSNSAKALVTGAIPVVMAGVAGKVAASGSLASAAAAKGRAIFATEPNQAYFWSGLGRGGDKVAATLATTRGGMTLEQITKARGIDLPVWDAANPASVQAWQNASRAYAEGARGDVRAIIGDSLRPGNIWEAIELPTLKANPYVARIIQINPATGAETVIFSRSGP